MAIERPHVTSYELAIAMFVRSVIVCEIFSVEMYMTLTLTFTHQHGAVLFSCSTDGSIVVISVVVLVVVISGVDVVDVVVDGGAGGRISVRIVI